MKSFTSFLFEKKTAAEVPTDMLSFTEGNVKIPFYSLNLPAGFSCPFAVQCKSWAEENPETGKWTLKSVKGIQFRCYAAADEAQYAGARNQRQTNFALLKRLQTKEQIADLIIDSFEAKQLDKLSKYFRLHVSGDFFSQEYFDAWILVAKQIPDTIFYAYTKSIPFWLKRKSQIPDNFRLTASYGGKYDNLIEQYGLKYVLVVDTVKQAQDIGLEIDIDDSHAYKNSDKPFCLLIHGNQEKGAKAKQSRENGIILRGMKSDKEKGARNFTDLVDEAKHAN